MVVNGSPPRPTVLELQRIYCNGQLTWARRRGDTWICMSCGSTVQMISG